jgi:hypothetical protein
MGVEGGTGKAEAAKLQDAGISPKQCPKKRSGRKRLAYRTRQQSAWGADRTSTSEAKERSPRDSVRWKKQNSAGSD